MLLLKLAPLILLETALAAVPALRKRDPKNVFDMSALDAFKKHPELAFKRHLPDLPQPPPHNPASPDQPPQLPLQYPRVSSSSALLASVLPQMRDILFFAGYLRDSVSLGPQTEWSNTSMLIIAPTNDAIARDLNGLKPWQFPESLDDFPPNADAIAARNLQHFVNAHVVTNVQDSIKPREFGFSATLNDNRCVSVTFVKGGLVTVQVDSDPPIAVLLSKQVSNGLVLVIDSVLCVPAPK